MFSLKNILNFLMENKTPVILIIAYVILNKMIDIYLIGFIVIIYFVYSQYQNINELKKDIKNIKNNK
tara:strand:- start:295 stop:495 length:201 start_codon:yes stop_codon:yes gene_type:complete